MYNLHPWRPGRVFAPPLPPWPFGDHPTLHNGIVSYFKFNEASGTRYDSVVPAHDLTSVNGVTSVPGVIGDAAHLVGASQQKLTSSSSVFDLPLVTVSAWVRFTTMGNRYIITRNQTFVGGFILQEVAASYVEFRSYGDGVAAQSGVAIATGNWYFVIGWNDGSNINISINDTDTVGEEMGTFATNTGVFQVGFGPTGGMGYLNGDVDEVGVWDRPLTAPERTALYNSGAGLSY